MIDKSSVSVGNRIEKRLCTIREAGLILSVGRSTIYDLIGRGELRTVYIGCSQKVDLESISKIVAEGAK